MVFLHGNATSHDSSHGINSSLVGFIVAFGLLGLSMYWKATKTCKDGEGNEVHKLSGSDIRNLPWHDLRGVLEKVILVILSLHIF